jgi:hypothetical protein
MDNISIHNCNIKDTIETKILRCCPHKFNILTNYEYLYAGLILNF